MAKTKIVSWSELDSLRQCALKHRIGYQERWRAAGDGVAQSRGRLFHRVMEAHYGAKKMWDSIPAGETVPETLARDEAEGFYSAVKDLLWDSYTGTQTEEQALVEWMYRGYVENFRDDPDWRIVAVEHKIEEWLPTTRGTRSSFRLKGTIDLVVRDRSAGGGLYLVDHKTCKDLPKGKEIDLDDQFTIYQWLMRKRGNDIRGVIYNAVRTTKLKTRAMEADERFKRNITVRQERELDTVVEEAYRQFREAYRGVPMVEREGTLVADVDHAVDPPRSPHTDMCRWRCDYTEACLAGRKGGDMRGMLSRTGFAPDLERH